MSVEQALAEFRRRFLHLRGVVGVGKSARAIRVYVADESVASRIPRVFNGIPVEVVVVGDVRAIRDRHI